MPLLFVDAADAAVQSRTRYEINDSDETEDSPLVLSSPEESPPTVLLLHEPVAPFLRERAAMRRASQG